jgi:hypothetical protein
MYAAPAWGHAAKIHINKLQKFQNRVVKIITNCPRYTRLEPLQNSLGIKTINQTITALTQQFYNNKFRASNQLITELGNYNTNYHVKHKKPLNILYPNPPKQK